MAIWTLCNCFHMEFPPWNSRSLSDRCLDPWKQSDCQTWYKGSSCSRVVLKNVVLLWSSQIRCWFCMCWWTSLWGNYQNRCVQVHLIYRFFFRRQPPFWHNQRKSKTWRLWIWLESNGLRCLRHGLCRVDLWSRCLCNERTKMFLLIHSICSRELVHLYFL